MANGDIAGSLQYSAGKWTGTMQLNGAEIPVKLASVPYFEDYWDYLFYRLDTPNGDTIGEAWSHKGPDGVWYLDIKVDHPESYFRLNRETEDRWVLTETLPFPEPEPEPETWPSHFERSNRSFCERCGETYHVDNLDDCKECGVTFCYKCGTGDLCDRCASKLKTDKDKA